jgi:predicted regulator of Ras-like GTPase activity (Roadblock/LC7/MglB family)
MYRASPTSTLVTNRNIPTKTRRNIMAAICSTFLRLTNFVYRIAQTKQTQKEIIQTKKA